MASASPLQMPWLATRYAKEMAAGDGVLIGKSGIRQGYMRSLGLLNHPRLSPVRLILATGLRPAVLVLNLVPRFDLLASC
ncbi:hypothetical protein [Anabaena sp. CCY 9910]|uniref:hypothetical protein n=1 Tax=Anabaena sp. CCY 9910 TaxID=3103870 RepID=UPI0039E08BC6